MDKIIYYFHNIIYNTYLMERRFKSEKEKIEYYKKLKVKENNIAQKNMDDITEAYHEIEFGVVPEVSDNRSLAEKIADERGQQLQAQKNTLMLMDNDGEEAIKLQNLIGTARYSEFNRHFLDIYNNLKNQVGRIRAQDAFQFIDKYLIKAERTDGIDIPNSGVLTGILNQLQTDSYRRDSRIDDIIMKLEALNEVINRALKKGITISLGSVPSGSSLNEIFESMKSGKPPEIVVEDLTNELSIITRGSLDNVLSGDDDDEDVVDIEVPTNKPLLLENGESGESGENAEDNFPMNYVDHKPKDEYLYDDYIDNLKKNTPKLINGVDKIRAFIYTVDDIANVIPNDGESDEGDEEAPMNPTFRGKLNFLFSVIGVKKTKAIKYGVLKDYFNKNRETIMNFYNHLKDLNEKGISIMSVKTKDQKNTVQIIENYLQTATNEAGREALANKLVDSIDFIIAGIMKHVFDVARRDNPDTMIQLVLANGTTDELKISDLVIDDRIMKSVSRASMYDLIAKKYGNIRLTTTSPFFTTFKEVSQIVRPTIDTKKIRVEYFDKLLEKITDDPYSTAYDYAKSQIEEINIKRVNEKRNHRKREEVEEEGKAVGGEAETKSGSGLKRFHQILKRRVY